MKQWTGIEVERARQGLEAASATVMGSMIFEFSRLDVALGLALVGSGEGAQIEKLTKKVEGLSFEKRLALLRKLVAAKYHDHAEAGPAYNRWLADADSMREKRNELVHGRWGVDHMKDKVVNVIGLPTSARQVSKGYTIRELKGTLNQMAKLQSRLWVLKSQWPI